MITKFEQLENKIKGIELSKALSPNLDKMQGYFINNKTLIYFPKDKSPEAIKQRLSKYFRHTDKYIRDEYVPMELIRANRRNNGGE